ncbi:MAG: GTP-dependent dephospho-CoA kinase family protein [Candidatus Bathyarchaeota archaeon]|nr:GTP-dependent dephospho-CoA kinase family protein [Candidatus Bathyarchaeota archaeon]MDH5495570.1 GTP-dependent dephospho-CoA kinase family protein [Candidatus Bathyarchaeota archaeon]
MIDIRRLTSQLRKKLKKPLGILFHGSLEETISILKTLIEKEKPAKIVTVGDRVSQDLTNHSLLPDVLIVDNKIMRKEIPPISATADHVLNVKNPPGTLTDEAWLAVEKAIAGSRRTKIVVEGEEDLLTLVAILAVPENSLVLYGQPSKGVVTVKATAEMKKKVREIVEAMKND